MNIEEYKNKVLHGDCLELLKTLPDNSVDSIVTDPPAGISFMGKSWDSDKGGRDNWIKWMSEVATECKRVLKSGGHAFVWAIPRTSHWTATAWENAGFEIRDVVAHVFGSGFPKSLNVGKAVDKLQGNEREVVGKKEGGVYSEGTKNKGIGQLNTEEKNDGRKTLPERGSDFGLLTKGTSEWEGWGTALKPAREDWILMRKPIEKGLTVAENCLKWGTGGINIDESRVGTKDSLNGGAYSKGEYDTDGKVLELGLKRQEGQYQQPTGRFPANLIHDNSEEVREYFPESKGGAFPKTHGSSGFVSPEEKESRLEMNDSGNASRFFKSIIYQAKASKSERNKGCEGLEEKGVINRNTFKSADWNIDPRSPNGGYEVKHDTKHQNNHPTVKPIALMEYLIKMVTPKGGIVLDPFAGSGSTLVSAKQNGFNYIGIELTEEYIPIIEARLNSTKVK